MKTLCKVLLLAGLLLSGAGTFAQQVEKSAKTEFIGGRYYYLHTIQSGQTLSAIAMAYGTKVNEILTANPGLTANIRPGQVIKVPGAAPATTPAVTETITIHIVKAGETLSGIASKYSLKLDELFRANPGLTPSIKPEQQIKIPVKSVAQNKARPADSIAPTFTSYTVVAGETLFSIARKHSCTVDELKKHNPGLDETLQIGRIIRIPVKGGVLPATPVNNAGDFVCGQTGILPSYNVGLMIPLYLNKLDMIDTTDQDRSMQHYTSFAFLGYYEGFLMAVDSLRSNGLSLKLVVEDIAEDSARLTRVLQKADFEDMHLMIGPFFSNDFTIAAAWARDHQTKIVNPFSARREFVEGHPTVIKNTASFEQQALLAVDYMRKTWPGCNIILSVSGTEHDLELAQAYQQALYGADSSLRDFSVVQYSKLGLAGILDKCREDKVNVVISFVRNEVSTSNFIRIMSQYSYSYPLVVFGPEDWEDYNSLESEYLLNINLHVVSSAFIDYEDPAVKDFVRDYRARYHNEPDKYAFSGYDAGLYFLTALHKYGKDFERCLEDYRPQLLETSLEFRQVPNGGFENTQIRIYRYQDFQRINAITNPQKEVSVNKKSH